VEITDPLVLQIIKSSDFQRLKGINQAGLTKPHWGISHYSRFEHCIGVYLLLEKFGAPREEQIAGLIHDLSHGVFSHALDYVMPGGDGGKQNHQDMIHKDFVKKTRVAHLIQKTGLDLDYILEDSNFPLKETELPSLCADRIDYCLRESLTFRLKTKTQVKKYLSSMIVYNQKWVFTDFETGQSFAQVFADLNEGFWAHFKSAAMFRTLGNCLRYALETGYIDQNDLYTTDQEVLDKLKSYLSDQKLVYLWERAMNKISMKNSPGSSQDLIIIKSRVIDPLFLENGKLLLVSDRNREWRKILKTQSTPKKYYLSFA
jgi:HD superfamily phosphohydrolase